MNTIVMYHFPGKRVFTCGYILISMETWRGGQTRRSEKNAKRFNKTRLSLLCVTKISAYELDLRKKAIHIDSQTGADPFKCIFKSRIIALHVSRFLSRRISRTNGSFHIFLRSFVFPRTSHAAFRALDLYGLMCFESLKSEPLVHSSATTLDKYFPM